MDDKIYEEIGNNYRFFLKWRHAAFAGQSLVLFATGSVTISFIDKAKEIAWIVPLAACPIGILLWMIDVRTRDVYHAALKAGALMENGKPGFYTTTKADVELPKDSSAFKQITQSAALSLFFWGSSLCLLLFSALLWLTYSYQSSCL